MNDLLTTATTTPTKNVFAMGATYFLSIKCLVENSYSVLCPKGSARVAPCSYLNHCMQRLRCAR